MALMMVLFVTAPPSGANPEPASDPGSWECTSDTLGLDEVTIEYADVAPGEVEANGEPVRRRPRDDGLWVPVVMVHGWTAAATHPQDSNGNPGTFSHLIDLSVAGPHDHVSRSLIGQLQGIPGAAVFTYDYHPYSARWVTDPHIGDGLGELIDCLFDASGQPVIVVGHSMGGLAAQYASAGGPSGSRADHISTVITLGTPFEGSVLATLADGALTAGMLNSRAAALLRLLLIYCGEEATRTGPEACGPLPPAVASFDSEAGKALRAGSSELASLPHFPPGITVRSLAGKQAFRYPGAGYFGIPWEHSPVELGDVVVTSASALRSGIPVEVRSCDATVLSVEVTGEDFWSSSLTFSSPLATSSCFHTNLPRSTELTIEVMFIVQDDVASRATDAVPGDPFSGTWAGDVDQPGAGSYSVRVTILEGEDGYTAAVEYPELNCSGEWVQESLDEDRLSVTELITEGSRCVNEIPIELTGNSDGSLGYATGGGYTSTATLHRVEPEEGTRESGSVGTTSFDDLTGRQEAPSAVLIWLGASAAWPDAPRIEYPSWSACDQEANWCLLGGTTTHTLVDVKDLSVAARIPVDAPDPEQALRRAGVNSDAVQQILSPGA